VTTLSASPIERPFVGHHAIEQIGGARLIALQDRIGQLVEDLVFADLVAVAQHRRFSRGAGAGF